MEQLYDTSTCDQQTRIIDICDKALLSPELFIKDVCDRAHVTFAARCRAQTIYRELSQLYPNKCTGQKIFAVAAYAIYTALAKLNTPRSVAEISFFSGVSVDAVWNVQKKLEICPPDDTANYVERVCSELELSYPDTLKIKKIVQKMSGSCGVRTGTLLASVVYMYSKSLKLNQICRVCLVTPSSVHKFISRIEPKYRKNISSLI